MSNIEKIRQEIERRKKGNMYDELPTTIGRYYEDRDLLAFIDSLPEESENHGCGVEFPHFGANYPDAKCIDGYLWDMDSYEDGIYTIGGDDPCPICNTEKWLKDVLDDEIFKTRDEALEYVKMLKSKYKHKDSLPEDASCVYDTNKLTPTPSVNIEDVARVQFASHAHVFDRKRKAVFDWEQFKEVAGIFYGFGKRDSLPDENNPEPYNPVYDEDYLNEKIAKATKSWEGVDVNKMLAECRGYEEKPSEDLEKAAKEYVKDIPTFKDSCLMKAAFEDGWLCSKEKMLKDAVEGFIFQSEDYYPKELVAQYNGELKHGDKVKIIIVKQDDRPRD